MVNFVHLHVHSPYSFQDGASAIEDLVAEAALKGMHAMAITDHNNASAAVRFAKLILYGQIGLQEGVLIALQI